MNTQFIRHKQATKHRNVHRRFTKIGILRGLGILCGLSIFSLLGCSDAHSSHSDRAPLKSMTKAEQREWLAYQIDDAIRVLGHEEGWFRLYSEQPWSEEREDILERARVVNCLPGHAEEGIERLRIELGNRDFPDPFDAAKALKEHWAAQGWDVSYVADPNNPALKIEYFRADPPTDELLMMGAGEHYSFIFVESACTRDISPWL